MGGFFLTNDEGSLNDAISVFDRKGLTQHTSLKLGDHWHCLYFSKWNASTATVTNNCFASDGDIIVGVGTFIYKGVIGTRVLELIYQDWDQGPQMLAHIKGHFNLIAYVNGELYVIADKTGIYHSYYATDKGKFYISSSFLCVAGAVPKLTLATQEALEFICSSTWYGNSTVFEEVKPLPYGMMVHIRDNLQMTPYFALSFDIPPLTVDQSYQFIREHFGWLAQIPYRISADLTGGADTRLINAILRSLGVDYRCYSYDEPHYRMDLEIARQIADHEHLDLDIYSEVWPSSRQGMDAYKNQINDMFFLMDGCRSVFAAACETRIHKYRARQADIVISGHAAELTRNFDWTKGNPRPALDLFFDACFTQLVGRDMREYKNNLVAKIRAVTQISDPLSRKDVCKIYYLTRCMGWAGVRITTTNQFCYQYVPFEDISLSGFLFSMPDAVILDNSFLKQLITRLDYALATYPSAYGYNFVYKPEERPQAVGRYAYELLRRLYRKMPLVFRTRVKGILRGGGQRTTGVDTSTEPVPFYLEKEFLGDMFGKEPLLVQEFFGMDVDAQSFFVQDNIYSLELLLRHFQSKLRFRDNTAER
jgi:hypothetical protein